MYEEEQGVNSQSFAFFRQHTVFVCLRYSSNGPCALLQFFRLSDDNSSLRRKDSSASCKLESPRSDIKGTLFPRLGELELESSANVLNFKSALCLESV